MQEGCTSVSILISKELFLSAYNAEILWEMVESILLIGIKVFLAFPK